jgi:hypothetical protein
MACDQVARDHFSTDNPGSGCVVSYFQTYKLFSAGSVLLNFSMAATPALSQRTGLSPQSELLWY